MHPFKDYLEIKGHNEAINWVVDLVKGDSELTEVFIRQLHELLLKESSESFAQTPDGKPTKKKIEVGKYKTLPNHVLTATGEMFYFASPEETPAKMHELIAWFRAEREKSDVNPIILATLFHYRFIRIHPFDDGNGRTARILMNFILMQNGFPPVIIKTEDKENYYGVLHLADVGELEPFIEYIAENLVHSLEIMIRGAKGKSMEEADDLDKELALLERKIRDKGRKIDISKNKDVVLEIYNSSITPLFESLIKACGKFNKFYVDSRISIYVDGASPNFDDANKAIMITRKNIEDSNWGSSEVNFRYFFHGFNQEGFDAFDFETNVFIKFEFTKFRVSSAGNHEFSNKPEEKSIILEKLYSEKLNQDEIDQIVRLKSKQHKDFIEEKFLEFERFQDLLKL